MGGSFTSLLVKPHSIPCCSSAAPDLCSICMRDFLPWPQAGCSQASFRSFRLPVCHLKPSFYQQFPVRRLLVTEILQFILSETPLVKSLNALPFTKALILTGSCLDGWWAPWKASGRLPWDPEVSQVVSRRRDGFTGSTAGSFSIMFVGSIELPALTSQGALSPLLLWLSIIFL